MGNQTFTESGEPRLEKGTLEKLAEVEDYEAKFKQPHPDKEIIIGKIAQFERSKKFYEDSVANIKLFSDQAIFSEKLNDFQKSMWDKYRKEFPEDFAANYKSIEASVTKDPNSIFELYALKKGFKSYADYFDNQTKESGQNMEAIDNIRKSFLSNEERRYESFAEIMSSLTAEIKSLKQEIKEFKKRSS